MNHRWLSVEEITEHDSVSKNAVDSSVSAKGLRGHRVLCSWKFKRGEVDAWVRAGGAGTGSDAEGQP